MQLPMKSSYLHSTMYLLNLAQQNTDYAQTSNLHSTMYLLNPSGGEDMLDDYKFTFHYVSIKSDSSVIKVGIGLKFTFHYVSIKSFISYYLNLRPNVIYIPLCIY